MEEEIHYRDDSDLEGRAWEGDYVDPDATIDTSTERGRLLWKYGPRVVEAAEQVIKEAEQAEKEGKKGNFREQGVAAICWKNPKTEEYMVLLVQSKKAYKAGKAHESWALPQGGLESYDPDLATGTLREAREELSGLDGLKPETGVPVGERFVQRFNKERICQEIQKGRPRPGKGYEHTAFEVSDIEDIDIRDYNELRAFGWFTFEGAKKQLKEKGNDEKYEPQVNVIKEAFDYFSKNQGSPE